MKEKWQPWSASPGAHAHRTGQGHSPLRAHGSKVKSPARVAEHKAPPSSEETRADGAAFREALIAPSPQDVPAELLMGGGAFSGGGGGQGGGEGRQQQQRGARRSSAPAAAARTALPNSEAPAEALGAVQAEWVAVEFESKAAGKVSMSVLQERGVLRARLHFPNDLAGQWMRSNLAQVEQQLAAELGCLVRLEMV